VSNNLSDLETKIQEKAMTVDMDICRRIDITARLCDVAQQRNCQETIDIFPVRTRTRTRTRPSHMMTSLTTPLSSGGHAPRHPQPPRQETQHSINEQTNKMFHQLSEFDDDSDSLVWEETEETLLLWEDFSGNSQAAETLEEQHEESIEKVISDTETLFKTRERDYQDTINQIELDLATAKSDMNRHLHEYMEMCSMKRGLDVQMETCRRLMIDRPTLACFLSSPPTLR
uniref:IF rod domain-containing protein n=1 Tax=Cynoglossus semilaevis TaxID=244447 RepID=A0A3P8WJI5_CYNSE